MGIVVYPRVAMDETMTHPNDGFHSDAVAWSWRRMIGVKNWRQAARNGGMIKICEFPGAALPEMGWSILWEDYKGD